MSWSRNTWSEPRQQGIKYSSLLQCRILPFFMIWWLLCLVQCFICKWIPVSKVCLSSITSVCNEPSVLICTYVITTSFRLMGIFPYAMNLVPFCVCFVGFFEPKRCCLVVNWRSIPSSERWHPKFLLRGKYGVIFPNDDSEKTEDENNFRLVVEWNHITWQNAHNFTPSYLSHCWVKPQQLVKKFYHLVYHYVKSDK